MRLLSSKNKQNRIFLYYQKRESSDTKKKTLFFIILSTLLAYFTTHYLGFLLVMKEPSMENNIKKGQLVLVNKVVNYFNLNNKPYNNNTKSKRNSFFSRISRGDIIAIKNPYLPKASIWKRLLDFPLFMFSLGLYSHNNEELIIRRVIAFPGDHFKIKNKGLYINNQLLIPNWNILFKDNRLLKENVSNRDNYKEVFILKNHIFVISDNWDTMSDSRSFSLLPIEKVVGKVIQFND